MPESNIKVKNYDEYSDEELFEIYDKTKDINVRNELVKRNLYIAQILSSKYAGKGIDYDDIYQVASLGLIYAITRFDISKGFKFSSFATPTIIGEIKKYFRDKGWQIRVPRRIQELSRKVREKRVELEQELKRVPKVGEIAKALDVTEEDVLEAMDASMAYAPLSLDIRFDSGGDNKDSALMELVGSEDESYFEIENENLLKSIMKNLTDEERLIIKGRFFENKTQMEVAKELGVSQMTTSRMEKRILKKLKKEYLNQQE